MISKFTISKLIYWCIGLILTIWMNIVTSIYGGEAAYLPFILIILIGLPSSLVALMLIYFLLSSTPLNSFTDSFIGSNLLTLSLLFAGYLQWFHFIARLVSNEGDNEDIMRNVRNLNAGGFKKSNKSINRT